MKKLLGKTVVFVVICVMLFSSYSSVLASDNDGNAERADEEAKVTDSINGGEISPNLAYCYTSSTYWEKDKGTWAYDYAYTYDGSPVYYLRATITAKYSNGKSTGPTSTNSNKYNISTANSGKVYENEPQRQFFGDSACRRTSSSTLETRSGKSPLFK